MADFTKSAQTLLGGVALGASIAGALGFGSTLRTPTEKQGAFDQIRKDILSDVRKFGIQRTNLGYVSMGTPNILGRNGINLGDQFLGLISTRASQFAIPAVSLATSELRRYGVGPMEKKPYMPMFQDITLDFIGDSNGNLHKMFYIWMNGVVNFQKDPVENASRDLYGSSSKHPYALEYKDNYKTVIVVRTFNDNQELLSDIQLHDAYPVSIGEIQYNWADENSLVRIPVTFTYTRWSYDTENPKFGLVGGGIETSSSGFDFVYKALSQIYPAAQAIELATRRPSQIQDVLKIVNAGKSGLSPITRYF